MNKLYPSLNQIRNGKIVAIKFKQKNLWLENCFWWKSSGKILEAWNMLQTYYGLYIVLGGI